MQIATCVLQSERHAANYAEQLHSIADYCDGTASAQYLFMYDLLCVTGTIAFFIVCFAYVAGCQKL